MRQIVVNGLWNSNTLDGVVEQLAQPADLDASILRIVSAVADQESDIVQLQYFEQTLCDRIFDIGISQLEAT